MIFIFPFVTSFLLGFLLVSNILKNSAIPHRNFYTLTLSTPMGFALISYLLFWSYVFGHAHAKTVAFLLIACTLCVLLIFYVRNKPFKPCSEETGCVIKNLVTSVSEARDNFANRRFSKLSGQLFSVFAFCLFVYCFFRFLNYFISNSLWNVNGGWDAAYVWNMKAKFYFRSPDEWRRIFLAVMNSYHPEYPLLLSGSIAWGWLLAGKEILIWPPLVALIFHFSITLLIIWYLKSTINWQSALVASGFFLMNPIYQLWAFNQYADVPLCFFMTITALTLMFALRTKEINLYFLAGLLAGTTAWTKNEGLFFVVWSVIVLLLAFGFEKPFLTKQKNRFFLFYLIGIAIPLSAALYILFFLAKSGDYVGSGRNFLTYWGLLFSDAQKTNVIVKSFAFFMFSYPGWNFLWIFFALAAIYGFLSKRKVLRTNYLWTLFVFVVLVEFGYLVIIHLSKYDLKFQIATALMRLLLHAGVIALIFTFEIFSLKPTAEKNE